MSPTEQRARRSWRRRWDGRPLPALRAPALRAVIAALAACALAALTVGALAVGGAGGAETGTIPPSAEPKPDCAGSLQAKIDAADPGATVELAAGCVYRESVMVDKPLTLKGGGTAEIRGSDVWSDWTRIGPTWLSAGSVPELPVPSRNLCEGASQRCKWPEQVFFDGRPLAQVASNPTSGQFAVDANRRVVLADDPAGHTVEVTTRQTWLVGGADGVTVRGITMKHAGGTGLWNGGHSDWTVRNNRLAYAHERNLSLGLGDDLVARGNDLRHAGQLGMSSNDAEVRIVGNRVHGNNTEGFKTGWEAGGMKIAQPRSAVISQNRVHHNGDIGIWIDVVNEDQRLVEISRNRVHHHPREGIRVEITKNFSVRRNAVWENGWGEGDSYNGAGISVNGSHDGTVADNVLAWNASGIGVVQQARDRAEEQPYQTTRNVRLERNRIVQDEIPGSLNHAAIFWNEDGNAVARGAPSVFDPGAGNGGSGNAFWFDEPQGETYRFKWDSQLETLPAFNDTPAENGGRYLAADEKDALLKKNRLPAAPEKHPPGAGPLLSGLSGLVETFRQSLP